MGQRWSAFTGLGMRRTGGGGGVTAELAGPGWPPSDWKQPHVGVPGPWGHLRAVSPPGQLGAHL